MINILKKFSVFLFLALSFSGCSKQNKVTIKNQHAQSFASQDILKQKDYNRLINIESDIQTNHSITDDDLSFALAMLNAPPVIDNQVNRARLQELVLSSLTGRKDLTKSQISKLLDAVVPIAEDDESAVQVFAVYVLTSTHDARVIPILEQISRNTKKLAVRHAATQYLPRLRQLLLMHK